jgi:hypothetical protein
VDFFSTFAYEAADAQHLLSVYDRIVAREDTLALWEQALEIYNAQTKCDFGEILSLAREAAKRLDIHTYTIDLLIFICLSQHLKELYIEQGIDLDIFHNSMLDLKYKLDECKVVKGVVGSFVASWFAGFFTLERFALGRLQFEIVKFGHHYARDGHVLTPESKVINIHIPRTLTHLSPQSCDEAFAMAKAHFGGLVDDPCAFVCHSWMLYPGNQEILPEDTNVYRFMSRFDICNAGDSPNHNDLWRIFDTDETNPDLLPTDTRMRRAYVNHLKNGGVLGWGHGVFFLA